ncbi:MAG: universal stress protein [bacterium]|nr:universal stress protein [bacterium]
MIIKEGQSILIPIDFSKLSYMAVKQSYSIAKNTRSKLILAHISATNENDRREDLESLAEATRVESGLNVEVLGVKGEYFKTIQKTAEELDCGIIMLALDENTKFKAGMFSSTMTVCKFLPDAPCPVITVRSTEQREAFKNIVLPFDLAPESREKVSFAVQLAHYYKADIRIVSVFKPNDDEYENKLLPYLQQVKKFIKQEGVHCTNRTLPSVKPAEAIIEYAVKNDCDLIIQITQVDVSISERLNGTAAHKVLELSPIPVLNVNPMKRESMSHFSSGM